MSFKQFIEYTSNYKVLTVYMFSVSKLAIPLILNSFGQYRIENQ